MSSKEFTPRRIQTLRPEIERVTAELLAAFTSSEEQAIVRCAVGGPDAVTGRF
ncbi:hypothetical protein ACFOWZ_43635 [Lentzea rhizosphaerae]|uniref:Uncharacterized protein n=1 Tax=Lentzea rhizosphaerae TaxID=2041025 RepID=A0ABV8C8X1_9PSEU